MLVRLFYLIGMPNETLKNVNFFLLESKMEKSRRFVSRPSPPFAPPSPQAIHLTHSSLILQMEKLDPTFLMSFVSSTKISSEMLLNHFLEPLQTGVKKILQSTKNGVFH